MTKVHSFSSSCLSREGAAALCELATAIMRPRSAPSRVTSAYSVQSLTPRSAASFTTASCLTTVAFLAYSSSSDHWLGGSCSQRPLAPRRLKSSQEREPTKDARLWASHSSDRGGNAGRPGEKVSGRS